MSNPIQTEYKFVISNIVKPSKLDDYETWIRGINSEVIKFDGFLGVDVIRPRTPKYLEFIIIMKFSTHKQLMMWQQSDVRHAWLDKSNKYILKKAEMEKLSGLELYFSFPNSNQHKSPAYYKLVIMGLITVFPLILIFDLIFGKLVDPLYDDLEIFISVIFVSLLLTNPLMPWLTNLLDFWLYPTNAKNKNPEL